MQQTLSKRFPRWEDNTPKRSWVRQSLSIRSLRPSMTWIKISLVSSIQDSWPMMNIKILFLIWPNGMRKAKTRKSTHFFCVKELCGMTENRLPRMTWLLPSRQFKIRRSTARFVLHLREWVLKRLTMTRFGLRFLKRLVLFSHRSRLAFFQSISGLAFQKIAYASPNKIFVLLEPGRLRLKIISKTTLDKFIVSH